MEQPSEALMADYAAGSADAFDELFRRHERSVWAFFRRRAGSEERAGDLYQELFLRLHRSRDTYDPSQPFLPWFFRIARNVWIDDVRRAFRAREVPIASDALPAADADAERRVGAREAASQALARLEPESLAVVVASKLLGKGYGEIARELGKSRDAVKQIASRSLRRLRAAESPAG